NAQFNSPCGVAVYPVGVIYVADTVNHTIRRITPIRTNWVVTTIAGLAGNAGDADCTGTNAQFSLPAGIALDNAEALYVVDSGNNTLRKIAPEGTNWVVTTIAGLSGISGGAN